jgi:anaerobic selenocysteine-containing dehydrogenase
MAYYMEKKYGLEEIERKGFSTPSKKIEIYSETFAEEGHDPLPTYREPDQSPLSTPELFEKYPLVLTTGARILYYTHSQHRNVEELKKRCPEPFAEIHPIQRRAGSGPVRGVANTRGRDQVRAR